jgi:hypothetical protein
MELVRSFVSIVSGLPCEKVRSAPAIVFSGPAQRSLTLWPARSPSRLTTLSIESSDSFVASAAVSIATGWNEPVPGRELHPLKSSAFHGALFRQLGSGLPKFPQTDRYGNANFEGVLNFLKPRLMHSRATVVIPLYDCVILVCALNGAELVCWFSEIAQTLDAITGNQFRVGSRKPRERWPLGAICVSSRSRV